MVSFAQLDRAISKDRRADGIRAAKERGVYAGRARKLAGVRLIDARDQIDVGVPKAEVARRLKVDRSNLCRALGRVSGPPADAGTAE